jgi:ribosomal protein S6
MRNYQLVLVLRPALSEAQKKKITDSVKAWIKDAKILKEEQWGEKPLSYKIKGENSGYFLNYFLETEQAIAADFEKRLFVNEDVIRHLLIRSKDIVKKEVKSKKEEKPEVKKSSSEPKVAEKKPKKKAVSKKK